MSWPSEEPLSGIRVSARHPIKRLGKPEVCYGLLSLGLRVSLDFGDSGSRVKYRVYGRLLPSCGFSLECMQEML